MNFLKKLFGGGGSSEEAKPRALPIHTKDYAITAETLNESGTYRVAKLIKAI